ncbi:MAG: outer membrane protein assembly factor BamA [Puniceicoccales bacterium]|jgi:outer membrane protein insertion porin family|nr:outer membrane protein assembly factor BamA [Puniceicoccales bacterium]
MKKFVNKNVSAWKKTLLVTLTCLALFPFPSKAFSENSPSRGVVRSIEYTYEGDKSWVNQSVVESHVQLKTGAEFSTFLADASLKALHATGNFDRVAIKVEEILGTDDCKVTFSLVPRARIKKISFAGNKNIKDKALLKRLGSKAGDSLSNGTLKADAEALTNFYHDKGYPYAAISCEINKNDDAGGVNVSFNIEEGAKFHVGKITFPGNDTVKESELRDAMATKKWTLLSLFNKSGVFRPEEFREDLDTIKAFFRNCGYLDVEIDEENIICEHVKNTLNIRIPVKCGPIYYAGDISINGNTLYSTEELTEILLISPGDQFSPEKIDASCEKIAECYGRDGYVNTHVDVVKKANFESDKIDLEFTISEKEKCFVGEIEICGNSKTKNKVILRELSLAPGDPFDTVRLKNSRLRLLNTGFFSFVDISPIDTKVPGRKKLRVEVKEDNTGKLGFGGGISTGGEIVGFVEFSQRNFDLHSENKKFQGGGQKSRARVQAGKHSLAVDLNFEEPWWYDRQLAIGTNLFFHKSEYDHSLREYSGVSYNETRLGGEIYLRKRLYEFWDGRLAYGLEDVHIYGIANNAPRCFFDEKGHTSVSKVTFSVERDTRDNFIYPTTGSKIEIDTEVAGGPFFGKTKYVKISSLALKHWLVFEAAEQVFSLIGRAGTVMPYGGDTVPFFDRFYMGGSYFMKGFKTHDIGPKENGTGIGGNTFVYGTTEYSIKIADFLRFYVFAEVGFINASQWNFSPKNYNTDIGFGLKISIMNMPLRLDFGFPLHGEEDNKHGMRFNYSFGVAF